MTMALAWAPVRSRKDSKPNEHRHRLSSGQRTFGKERSQGASAGHCSGCAALRGTAAPPKVASPDRLPSDSLGGTGASDRALPPAHRLAGALP